MIAADTPALLRSFIWTRGRAGGCVGVKRVIVILVGTYLVAIAGLAATTGEGLISPVANYRLSILWLSEATLANRMDALFASSRLFEADIYEGMHLLSVATIWSLGVIGLARPWLAPSEPIASIRSSAVVFGSIGLLFVLAHVTRPILDQASQIPSVTNTLSAMPAYWIFGLAVSAAILGAHLCMVAHDLSLAARQRFERWRGAAARPV